MEKEPTPIGRGEQINLEKKLETTAVLSAQAKELAERLLEIRKQIEEEHGEEMKRPEWARRQSVLDRLQNEFEENNRQLDGLLGATSDLQAANEYIGKRHKELEERKKEEGY